MTKSFDITGFGICAVDYLGLVAQYPETGQKVRMEAFSKQGGGLTGTALAAAARLGAVVAFIGKFGHDEYSRFLLAEFQKDGVDIRRVIFETGAQPPIAFIHVEKSTGERCLARFWKEFELKPEELNREVIQNSRILFLEHHFTAAGMTAARLIKNSGGLIVMDAEREVIGLEPLLQLADYVILSNAFASQHTGSGSPAQNAVLLQEKYSGVVVVTAGAEGNFCATSERVLHQPAFPVEVVDTTGAGDVFHGAFMVGLIENWPLPKIMEFSAAVAAMKCRGLGGRAMIPNREEAGAFLLERGTPRFWEKT